MKTNRLLILLVLMGALLLASCNTSLRVGELKNESRSVELDGAEPVRVEIEFGGGDLRLSGGAEQLLEADFAYNVAQLQPQVKYAGKTLVVRQPGNNGMPSLSRINEFRNEWGLRLYNDVPMDLSVAVGGGSSDLQLAGLSLTRLDINQGAGTGTIDLTGDWPQDLYVTIDAGATDLAIMLPSGVGVRVEVDRGPTLLDAPGMARDGNIYTNDAYGESGVTLRISITTGIGIIHLLTEGSA